MAEINWTVTKEEREAIGRIVDRAMAMSGGTGDRMTLVMDLTATHANGCPLDLAGLADAEEFDFAHDLTGIVRHIDRETGTLGDCFLPRYAKRGE